MPSWPNHSHLSARRRESGPPSLLVAHSSNIRSTPKAADRASTTLQHAPLSQANCRRELLLLHIATSPSLYGFQPSIQTSTVVSLLVPLSANDINTPGSIKLLLTPFWTTMLGTIYSVSATSARKTPGRSTLTTPLIKSVPITQSVN